MAELPGSVDFLADERRKAEFEVEAMKLVSAGGEEHQKIASKMKQLVANDPGKLIPAIKGQATDEQQKKWLSKAYKMHIIGCPAQTELGHGSNVQGLETTATFDPSSDEFVIHSPSLTCTKWWPGGLGQASTHALVYARLITDNQDYGVHAFIVPIRSLDNHQPLQGVTVGDIGVKFGNGGYNTMDNGYLRFDQFRIPRENMLQKLAEVTRFGKYTKSKYPRQLGYGAMVFVRQSIVKDASTFLSRAVTIAVRYSAVRRQFGGREGRPEIEVMDYSTQQIRLFPLVARDGIEECLKLCGGHGYLCNSGLSELYAAYVPACTYEGDNTILLLQKGGDAHICKKLLEIWTGAAGTDWLDNLAIIKAFQSKAAWMAGAVALQIAKADNQEAALEDYAPDLMDAARAHCQLIIVEKFIEKLETDIPGKGTKELLQVLSHMCGQMQWHWWTPLTTPTTIWDQFWGRFDGDVHSHLYNDTKNSSLNDLPVTEGYKQYLRPVRKDQLRKSRL